MATGIQSDFVIYNEEFQLGATEVLAQDTNVFNAASGGTILLTTNFTKGVFEKSSFYANVANLVDRIDRTSTAAATAVKMTQSEIAKVKLDRRIGPIEQTVNSFVKVADDPRMMSFILGQQWAKEALVDQLNTALSAGVTAFGATLAQNNDTGTINHAGLVQAMSKMGDAGNRIRAFVMHSKTYYDLMQQSIADKITDVAGVTIMEGSIASLGRPVIVTDSTSLISAGTGPGGVDEYQTLALVENAIEVENSEARQIWSETVLGGEQVFLRIQGEYAFNLGLKGFTWDVTNGGENPTSAAIATATNWDKVVVDNKNTGGVVLTTQ